MKSQGAPIIHHSERLLRELVITASKMPKDYKWVLGNKLRDDAVLCLLLAQKAFRNARNPAIATPLLHQLADLNDGIQALLQVSYDVRAIKAIRSMSAPGDFLCSLGQRMSSGHPVSPRQQQALFNSIHARRRDITDKALLDFAADRAKGYDQ